MIAPEDLTPEQRQALAALEYRTGEWGEVASVLGKAHPNAVPALSPQAIAHLEAIRLQALKVSATPIRSNPPFILHPSSFILAIAASLAVLAAVTWFLLPHRSPNAEIAIASPRGETPSTQPVINWQAKPGQSYDVWILPPEGDVLTVPAVFKVEKVRPPVDFAVLKPGKGMPQNATLTPDADYRVLVCYADTHRIGGIAVAFHVKSSPPKKP